MDTMILSFVLIGLMLALLAGGVWVGMTLLGVALFAMQFFSDAPAFKVMATQLWGSTSSWALSALPLFIWMGEILFRSRLPSDMFSGLSPWLGALPGRLMHVNVVGCGIFAAVSGSSAATCATVGKIALPELERRGYDEKMILGSLAASGTLGLMIPPSIIMIVYGVAAEVSISRLFIAGVLPGLLLIALFMGYIALWSYLHPERVPPNDIRLGLLQKIWATRTLIPVVLLIGFVIGSIYMGFATATEAAVMGVVGALLLSWLGGTLTWASFSDGLTAATMTSCMVIFILAAASFLSIAMGFTGIPRHLAEWIQAQHFSLYTLLFVLTLFFIFLGCFLDGISIVVLTAAIILPTIEAAGIDLIWFGIYCVIVVEMSAITPPVGFNLFVLQGMSKKTLGLITRGTMPFFFLLCAAVALLIAFPEIATYLPEKMNERN
jgi:tripartite ATP-independent transporter DctM subunit